MSLELLYGNAVSGKQRFERTELQDRLMRTLASSGGVKMFGLRRIGKSTLRLFVAEQLKKTGKPYAFVDAQGLQSIEDLLAELFRALPRDSSLTARTLALVSKESPIKSLLEGLAKGTKLGENLVTAYWKEAYNCIRDALKDTPERPVLIIDEFPFLLKNVLERDASAGRDQVNQLLAAMREWRGAGMKMLLTGSIGMTALSRKYGLSRDHLNDLLPFDVPELTVDEARQFVRQATECSPGGAWSEEHTVELLKQTGVLYPSFLVKGLLELGISAPPTPEDFADIFATRVRPVLHEDFYEQFRRRFRLYGEIDKQLQGQLVAPALKRIVESETAARLDDMALPEGYTRIDLAEVLDMLVEDGFVRFAEDAEGNRSWLPGSRLAKLWWKRARLA
ncbi:MAG: hypothetical protein KF778_06530 [Rhodocyclaceae bacterium]|nr:hypothetical protein [Rhodocyclaceae bacterium]